MKAWYKEALDKPLRCADRPDPEARPGSVVVDVLSVHVPGYLTAMMDSTDIPLPVPLVLGAGGIGVVRTVGEDVYGLSAGDVVALDSMVENDDADNPQDVLMGLGEIGGRGVMTEGVKAMREQWRDGTMAQQAVLPRSAVTRLPGAEHYANHGRLAFLTWLGIAGEGVVQSGQKPGDIVAVLGATGQMGGAAVLVALARGASRVIAVGRNEAALSRLSRLDARVTTVKLSGDVTADAMHIGADGAPHVVVDAMGGADNANAVLSGLQSLRDEGTLVLMGGVRLDVPIPYGEVLRRRLTIRGSRMYRPDTILSIWRMIQSGLIDLSKVEMHEVGIDDPAGAVSTAAKSSGLSFVSLIP